MKKYLSLILLVLFCTSSFYCLSQNKKKQQVHLNHIAIFVVDLKKSGDFYTKIIGLDTIPEPFKDGKHIWLQIAPHIQMHIIQGATQLKDYYKNQHNCFSVVSISKFTMLLTKNNIVWEDRDGTKNAITTRIDGVHQIWLQDPDGYWVEINDAKD